MSDIGIGPVLPRVDVFKPVPEVGEAPRHGGTSFGKVMKSVVGDAIETEQEAAKAIQDFASGNADDVHDVVMAVGKANIAISLLVEVRNGILDAYNQLSKIAG
jgi:flagellar hook-basal body complex protein FliE